MEEDKPSMKKYATEALEAAEKCGDSLWTYATLAEAHLYIGNLYASREYYEKAAALAEIRQKISMHLNAHAAYLALYHPPGGTDDFTTFLKEKLLT